MKIFLIFPLFSFLSDGMKIDCEFKIQNWITIGHMYTCNIVGVDFCGNEKQVTEVNGTHLPNYSNKNVSGVATGVEPLSDCSKFHLTFIPKGLMFHFPNLTGLRFYDCDITTLDHKTLEEFPNLTRFGIINSMLQQIPENFFAPAPNMRSISFEHNIINKVGKGLLDNLPELEHADFTGNVCINVKSETKSEVDFLKRVLEIFCQV
jgi:hypothetical protein